MTRIVRWVLILVACACFGGCGRTGETAGKSAQIRTAADLKGRHVAHLSSDFHRAELRRLQPELVFDPYTEYAFAFESLRKDKIAAISLGRSYADVWMARYPGEFEVAFDYAGDICCFLLPKKSALRMRIDTEIRRMRESGETARIIRRWLDAAVAGKVPDLPRFDSRSDAPVLRVASAALAEPWCFVSEERLVGADIEILETVAHRLGMRPEYRCYSFEGMVSSVNAGRCDIANGHIYTGGNVFPTVDATEKYADERMCVLVRSKRNAGARNLSRGFAALKDSFVRTFVTEDRWRMILRGFGTTLLIAFLATVFGTFLAFPVWLARTSSRVWIASCSRWYIAVLQGTPLLVLLMVLFYLVFGRTDVEGLWIAVLGFSLNASAYIGEMLRSGIDSVPRGQTEAALALGYGPKRAFLRFVLPQAVRTVLPMYRGLLVAILKNTSIVGYIAINDLTKAGDLVRSRTYESFFPIITTAFIYFVASWLLAFALERVGRRLDPAWRRMRKSPERIQTI